MPDPRVPDDWPRLAGVSAAVSHARLKGYQPLFFQLAQRILGLVDAFPETDGALLARDLPTLAQTLHDLKGMTGSMGATALYDMVASAEKAAREGDDVAVATLLPRLRNAVHGWRVVLSAASAVPPTVSAAPDGPAAAQVVEDPGLAERIGQFRQALASRDLAALDAWTELSGPVERWWGAARVAELQGHLDALEFVRAAALVDACLPTAHAGHG
ncbi:MAG: Hpt domain-containing protein [Acidovorax sp.]|uniref:Hpt domain-containing protein n=1 Tax=Acidovorax sp. TaxID=1872122 RepID=UPI002613FBF6|nr:Hpt domain-containing protein [Acidovorax sp.]MDH4465330.1 Hpt domain-containing protein [Acidovorax sp.]